jgi:hypothetical protein
MWEVQTTDTHYRLTDLIDSGSSSVVVRFTIDRVTGGFVMLVPGAKEGSVDIVRGACVPGGRGF